MQELGTNSFIDAIRNDGIVVVDFSAESEPCRAYAKVFDDAAKRHADVRFATVDTDANPELARALDIRAIPTVVVFRESVLVFRRAGPVALDDVVAHVKALDMADVLRHAES
jgi:thioredoxin-like negative regulator of GroEL